MMGGIALPKRLVLVMTPFGASDAALRETAAFARSLDLRMLGLVVEDERVLAAAGHPFTREIGRDHGLLRPVSMASIEKELDQYARRLQQRLRTSATDLSLDVVRVRGAIEHILSEHLASGDVATFFEPQAPVDRALSGPQTAPLAKQRTPMVLDVPSMLTAASGCIAVFASAPSDRAFMDLGAEIARRTGKALEIWTPSGATALEREALAMGARHRDIDPMREHHAVIDQFRARVRLLVVAPSTEAPQKERLVSLARLGRTPALHFH